jgi:hypothetical protein
MIENLSHIILQFAGTKSTVAITSIWRRLINVFFIDYLHYHIFLAKYDRNLSPLSITKRKLYYQHIIVPIEVSPRRRREVRYYVTLNLLLGHAYGYYYFYVSQYLLP